MSNNLLEVLFSKGQIRKGREFVDAHRLTPTGIDDLDNLIGGGWSSGINLITGLAGTGKSLICALGMSEQLQQGRPVLVVDTECSYDLWQQHIDLSQAWLLPPKQNPFLPIGFDFSITATRITEYIAWAEANNTPLGLVVIDALNGFIPRDEQAFNSVPDYLVGNHQTTIAHAEIIDSFLRTLHQFALRHRLPILLTYHDYEQTTSFINDLPTNGDEHPSIMTETEKNVAISLATHNSITISTSPLYQYPGNPHLSNTPFIATGNYARMIDFDKPDRFLLGVQCTHNNHAPSKSLTSIAIPFSYLINFNYFPPTNITSDIRQNFTLGVSYGGDEDEEPARTGTNDDDS